MFLSNLRVVELMAIPMTTVKMDAMLVVMTLKVMIMMMVMLLMVTMTTVVMSVILSVSNQKHQHTSFICAR